MIETIIITAISSLPIGSAIGWFFSQKKRNNDFIADLQNSIDLLSDNYTKTLDGLVVVKKQNADLLIIVSQLESELVKLREENNGLMLKMNEFISQLEPELAKLKEENSALIKKMNELKKILSVKKP